MIKLTNILWSTRGYEWGFLRLLEPQFQCTEWLIPYQQMFPESSSNEPKFYSGEVKLPDNNKIYKYVAIRFLDPNGNKDRSNRIIPHEIALLGEDSQDYRDFESFQSAIWEYLAPIYEKVYKYEIKEIESTQILVNSDNSLDIVDKPNKKSQEEGKSEKKSMKLGVVIMAGLTILIIILVYLVVTQKHSGKTPLPQNQSQQIPTPMEKVMENNSPPQTIPSMIPEEINKAQSEILIQQDLDKDEKTGETPLVQQKTLDTKKEAEITQENQLQKIQ